ncbi:MAG: hypothetical protein ACLPY1_01805 [Terracidiphilus sp.]
MRKILSSAALAAVLLFTIPATFAAPPATSKGTPGTIVIVFKDGHRQSFNLADIERVEFPTSDFVGSSGASGPSRGRFLGKWEVGDGTGNDFYITLQEDGNAMRSIGNVHGHWNYVDGEAQIIWDDGAEDAIRRIGSRYQKFAYNAGKSFTDTPENVTNARNLTPKPI